MIPDQLQRPLRSLRISVTDRCNLRCTYCMPEQEYVWLPKSEFPAARPLWRGASFVYQPGTTTWSGDVMPALGKPLLVVN